MAEGVSKSQVSVKTVLTVALTMLALVAVLFVLGHAKVAIGLTVGSALLAVAMDHATSFLQRRGLPRSLAIVLVTVGLVSAVGGVLLLLVPPAVSQGTQLVREAPRLIERARGTGLYQRLQPRLQLDRRLKELQEQAEADLLLPGLKAVGGFLSALAAGLTLLFLTLFMLLFGGEVVRKLLEEALPVRKERYQRVLTNVYRSIGGYLGGLSFICLVNAACTTVYLAVTRVPFFLALGVLSGLSSLVPLVGNTVAGALITLVALATRGFWYGVATAAWFVLYQQFENHLLGPAVYKRTVEVNPLVVLLGVLYFADLSGIWGALVAVPAVAAGQIVLRELLSLRRERLGLPQAGPVGKPLGQEG